MTFCYLFARLWVLFYHRPYWGTCCRQWPQMHRTADGWFVSCGPIEIGWGDAK